MFKAVNDKGKKEPGSFDEYYMVMFGALVVRIRSVVKLDHVIRSTYWSVHFVEAVAVQVCGQEAEVWIMSIANFELTCSQRHVKPVESD